MQSQSIVKNQSHSLIKDQSHSRELHNHSTEDDISTSEQAIEVQNHSNVEEVQSH